MTARRFEHYSLSGGSMKTLVRHAAFLVLSSLILSLLSMAHASPSQASPYQIATLEGHAAWVNSVSFPSAGTMLASGSFDNAIRLWDVASRQSIATLEGHTRWVWSVSLSPNGGLLASGSSDGTIKLWDVASRQELATLTGSNSDLAAVLSVVFSPDGTMLASGSDGAVRLWDVASGQHIATLEGHTDWISSVSFSLDGGLLASGSFDNTIRLWDVASRQEVATLAGHTSWVQSVSFSPNGELLASGADDKTIKLWDVASRQHIATLEGHTDWVNSVSFSPNRGLLASGSSDGTIKLWDVASRQHIATLEGSKSEVRSVSFSPDEALLAFGLADGMIALWDVSEWMRSSSEEAIPLRLTKVSGEGQEGAASTQLAAPFVVSVLDQDDSPLAGVAVTFSVTAGGGILSLPSHTNPCTVKSSTSSTTVTTDANGHAATRLTLGNEPETNTVEATVEGLEPVTFTTTAAEQSMPHRLAKVCGDDQEGTAGKLLAAPFVVSVSDEDGTAMAGVDVSFRVTAGEGTLLAATATTNANGRARTWLTLDSELGTNTVEATVVGLESVIFTATGQKSPLVELFDDFMGSGKRVALPDSSQLEQNAPNPSNSQIDNSY